MTSKSTVTFQELYKTVDEFRKEFNIRFDQLDDKIDSNYITRDEAIQRFIYLEEKVKPIQTIIYGIVGLILTGIMGSVLSLIIKR